MSRNAPGRRSARTKMSRKHWFSRSGALDNSRFRLLRHEQLEDRRMLAAVPTIVIDDVQQSEGDSGTTNFVFTVTRSGKTNQPSTIAYTTSSGTATLTDNDYQPVSGTLDFASGQKLATIPVPVIGDSTEEGAETFFVDLTIVSNGQFGDSHGVGTIVNDDMGPSLPALTIDDVQLVEGDGGQTALVFTVLRSGDSRSQSWVDYSTTDGTATISDNDYMAASGTLSFAAGEDAKTILVAVVGDTLSEGSEVLYVDLSAANNAVITIPRGTGLIVGDDGGLAPPQGLVSWWTADGTAADLMQRNDAELVDGTTFAAGMVGQAFNFDGVNDRVQLPDSESLKLTESLSIEGWIKADSLPVQQGEILFRGDDRGGLDPYSLSLQSNGSLRFEVASLNGAASVWAPLPLGEFTHVAGTLDDASGEMRLYLDGVLISQITTTQRPFGDLDPASNPGIGIGNHGGAPDTPHNFAFDGLIDELSVYNRALTTEEVQRIYYTGSQGKVKMTVANTNPEYGSIVVWPPSQYVIDFTFPIDSDSLQANDLIVNGYEANQVVLDDPDTATFSFVSNPVTTQGLQTMFLAENAVLRDSDGVGLAEYVGQFRYDMVPLTVLVTDPAPGSDLVLESLTAPSTAVASMAGIDGGNGGWPVLYGTDPISPDVVKFVIDEDTWYDTERSHTTEQLAYMAFDGTSSGNEAPYLRTGVVPGVSNTGWTTVDVGRSYGDKMVVVATANYSESSPPLVTRVQQITDDTFQVKVDRADGLPDDVTGIDVHYVVVEAGVYANMEAIRVDSTITDGAGSWIGESQAYQNVYAQPVVIGQVMTANDPAYSVFWARGDDSTSAPSSSALYVGKHVGEDPNQVRADETIGYIVIEQGKGAFGSVQYLAALGADAVMGMDEGPTNNYLNLSSLQVTFSEPMDPASVGGDDLALSTGRVTSVIMLGDDTVQYDLVGVGPGLKVDISAGAVTDQHGNPSDTFTATYNPVPTKFFVVDGTDRMFEYGAGGASLVDESWALGNCDEATGATANAEGTRIWVLDFDMLVFVFDTDGGLIGSWSVEKGGAPISSPNGIATDGTDMWIVDAWGAQVKRYAGAAARESGSQGPVSSFKIDKHGTGITTDGSTIWIVNSGTDRVYAYSVAGEPLYDWLLHSANVTAEGITIDPTGASDSVWVVDRGTDSVYEYNRNTGAFLGSFALAAGNSRPFGIADPPPPLGRADVETVTTQKHVSRRAPNANVPDLMAPTVPRGTRHLPVDSHAMNEILIDSSLLLPETLLEVTQRDFVDHANVVSDVDTDMWLLPMIPADFVERPQGSPAAIDVHLVNDIADEETELLDEGLLNLIAASQN